RLLPAFARPTALQRLGEEVNLEYLYAPGFDAFLFPDTFVNYYEPDLGIAAVNLLRHLGSSASFGFTEDFSSASGEIPAEIWPTRLRCCGRPLISNGLLDQAVANAAHNVERLYPYAATTGFIHALEPSCLLTIKDDYPALLRGEQRRKAE